MSVPMRRAARRRLVVRFFIAMLALLSAAAVSPAAARNFEQPVSPDSAQQFGAINPQREDTPNDPDYDRAESDDEDKATVPASTNIYDEQFGFFGFASERTRLSAKYREGPNLGSVLTPNPMISGFNASGAWKLERGRPDVAIAILDTGIKWDRNGLRTQVRLNRGELPQPAGVGATCSGSDPYDCNNDGVFNVLDYTGSTVSLTAGPHGSPQLDPEDLIATFGHDGVDGDGNGFVDDVAGWDFFDNDNDPWDASSYFAAANHGSGRATEAVERGDDGEGGIGICPRCQIIPIRTWDTFVSDGNTFAMGIIYAADNGARVIEGANGSLYHSAFAERASQYAYEKGVVQTFSGDDLNTANHNYPANYGHAMLIQGTVPDTMGLGEDAGSEFAAGLAGLCSGIPLPPPVPAIGCPGTNVPVATYFRGANTTQFGGKSSISMEGATGSENTGKAAGAAALVVASALDHRSPSNQPAPIVLRPDETRAILEQTAERVTGGASGVDGNVDGLGTPDPGADPNAAPEDQWTSHFGWGRVDLGAAVALARSGAIPPEVAIDGPDWYAPLNGDSIAVSGVARARFATGGQFDWKLEWGVGQAPESWTTVEEGSSNSVVTAFGEIDLDEVRTALSSYTPPLDPGGPTFSALAKHPLANEFTVRVIVEGAGIATPGIDRRVLVSAADPTLRDGFPKRLGTGGEAPLRYADLDGDGTQELIVPTEDGAIHAYEPDGSELPGWPVHTQQQLQAAGHAAAPGFATVGADAPPLEAPRGALIADLDDDGRQELIDTAGTHVYAWEPDGTLRPDFPVEQDLANCDPSLESQPLSHPKCGFLSSPAVARLGGPGEPFSIVVPALDGHLYAFDGDGDPVPGYPVRMVDPAKAPSEQMRAESINEPAIGDLTGDGVDDVVVATNETYEANPPSGEDIGGLIAQALTALLANAAGGSSRVYAINGATGAYLPGWPIKLNGAIQTTLPLIGPGQNPAIVKVNGETRIVASTTGSVTTEQHKVDSSLVAPGIQQGVYGPGSDATDRTGTINLFESASIGKLLPGSTNPAIVKYGLTISDAANLLLVGQNAPYNHLIGAYDAATGTPLPAFPRVTDDFQFLSSSNIAKVVPGETNQVLAGTGLGLLHAYDGLTGLDVAGFPKVTGGWLYSPAAVSDDGRIAAITREGYLFEWDQANLPECQSEWPTFRHDQQGSGNYDRDGTPPGVPSGASVKGDQLGFVAPGDDGGCGTADRYEVVTSAVPIGPEGFDAATPVNGSPAPGAAGSSESFAVSGHGRYVAVRAVDEAGNVGPLALIDTAPATGNPGGEGGKGGSGGGAGSGGNGGASGAQTLPGPCANLVQGSTGADELSGGEAGDLLLGLGGPDRLNGLGGKDCLGGGRGRDVLEGGDGNDTQRGNGGRDVLVGGAGRDVLRGGIDQDTIHAADDERDLVNCGVGRRDVAIADPADRVRGCERVRRE
jgi:Subtilase family/RTX calcium-binding nonapeptide repeat (4 copies)